MVSFLVKIILLSITSGLLLCFAWPNNGIFPFLFVGFIPLLFALKKIAEKTSKFSVLKAFIIIFLTYLTWVALSLTWLYNTAVDSYLITILLISLNYSIPLSFFTYVYKKLGETYALTYFVCSLLIADWISQTFLLTSPYFNLGLGLGKTPWLIQHYKIIGVEGGSLWIALSNVLLFKLISDKTYTLKKLAPLASLLIIVPVLSITTYQLPDTPNKQVAIATIHHSNINPSTKFAYDHPVLIIDSLFNATFNNLSTVPDIVVWPESIIVRVGWLHKIDQEPVIQFLKNKLKKFPNTSIIFGALGFSHVKNKKNITKYTTFSPSGGYYYDTHNIAITVSANNKTLIKSKEKFVAFHERVPYVDVLPFLTNLIDTLGTRAMFSEFHGGNPITTDINGNHYESILCYESLFSLFMIKKSTSRVGAFLIHANEHWLKDFSGSQQYLYENVAMAIQGGKPLLRSSNSGISAIINEKGQILSPVVGRIKGNITLEIPLNYSTTFYSKIAGSFYSGGGLMCFLILLFSTLKTDKS